MNLKEHMQKTGYKQLQDRFGVTNVFALPRLNKVVINVGIGRVVAASSKVDDLVKRISEELTRIVGQKPIITKAKKSIASFKIREGMPLGLKVTLHGDKMYDFLERVIKIALPRTRDFRGLAESNIDQFGNFTVGIKDHTVFPEASADALHSFGLEFTAVVKAKERAQAVEFFKVLGFPLARH
jgi:large subunit ribosomal protein L5